MFKLHQSITQQSTTLYSNSSSVPTNYFFDAPAVIPSFNDGAGESLVATATGHNSGFQNPPNSLASSLMGSSGPTSVMPSVEGTSDEDMGGP